MTAKKYILGVDIGGTKVAAGLVTDLGEIAGRARISMIASSDAATALASVSSAIDRFIKETPDTSIAAMGLSAPGPLDPRTGLVINPPNIPWCRNFPLGAEIESAYAMPVVVDIENLQRIRKRVIFDRSTSPADCGLRLLAAEFCSTLRRKAWGTFVGSVVKNSE